MNLLSGLGNKIRNKLDGTRARLDSIKVEREYKGVKATVTASKNVLNIDVPAELLQKMNQKEVQDIMVHALNLALRDAEGIAVSELKNAGDNVIPGFAKIFNRRAS